MLFTWFKDSLKIPRHKYTKREKTVVKILKKNFKGINSYLNVGFHDWDDERKHWWINICKKNNIKWKILEIFQPNIKNAIDAGCPKENIFLGNILDISTYENFDCIMFWHGPEHIEKGLFLEKLGQIEKKANKLIIFGMPHGEEIQEAVYGNKYEEHISAWHEDDWHRLGYKTMIVNDRNPGHITAFKCIED
mgnify:FL=1|jgi:hypothetical protein|tara:strand:- start:1824 stop:2399 length:576 start_codon:yes stop_codon:yes gene_type:complete